MIPLDPGVYNLGQNGGSVTFNNNRTDLPLMTVNTPDIGAILNFFTSATFSGPMMAGESQPAYTQGLTSAFLNKDATEIGAIFDRLAKSMTNQLQQGATSQLAHSLTSHPIVYIRVRWEWLSLPLAIQLSGGVLLLATMFRSRRGNRVALWKSSPTALLYHRIDSDGVVGSGLKGPEVLDKLERSVEARLE